MLKIAQDGRCFDFHFRCVSFSTCVCLVRWLVDECKHRRAIFVVIYYLIFL